MAPRTAPRMRAKRPNGEGGYWYSSTEGRYRAQYTDVQGHLRSVSAKSEADITKKLSKAIDARDRGLLGGLASKTPTVGDWLDHWLGLRDDLRPRTREKYELDIRARIKPNIGSLRLDKLQPIQVESMYRALRERGLADTTVHHVHSVLHAAYREAFRLELVAVDVMDRVKAPKMSRKEINAPTLDQAKQILEAASEEGRRAYARWALALRWGMRQGEVLGLRWEDVDLDEGRVRVRQALQRQTGRGLVVEKPKSRAGQRTFTIDEDTLSALRAWRREQSERRLLLGQWPDHDLVFTGDRGNKIDGRNEHRIWKRILERAGVPHYRIHDCRHTAATIMLEAGIPDRVVMEILGHSQISLTLNTYVHVSRKTLDGTAEKVAAIYGS